MSRYLRVRLADQGYRSVAERERVAVTTLGHHLMIPRYG